MTDVIDQLGGATKVAKALGMKRNRVSNWRDRGIPWRYRVAVAKLAMTHGIKLPADFLEAAA